MARRTTVKKATVAPVDATPAERATLGKAARSQSPRSSHGDWAPASPTAPTRSRCSRSSRPPAPEPGPAPLWPDAALTLTFYRGAAAVMTGDLAARRPPACGCRPAASSPLQLRRLRHADRHLVFDINDFDESLPAPWEWDLKRLAASFVIGARHRGFDDAVRHEIVLGAASTYREAMRGLAGLSNLDVLRTGGSTSPGSARCSSLGPTSASARPSRRPSRRRSARTACAPSRSSPPGSTADCESQATRPSSSRSRRWSRASC